MDTTHQQEQFLYQIIDTHAVVSDCRDPQATIEQWRRFTASHDDVHAEVASITVSGSHVVTFVSAIHAHISYNTFRLCALYPSDLQQRFIDREEVAYRCSHH